MFSSWLRAQRPMWLIIALALLGIGLEIHAARQKAKPLPPREQYDARGESGQMLKLVRD